MGVTPILWSRVLCSFFSFCLDLVKDLYFSIKFRYFHRTDGRQARIMKKDVSICFGFHPSLETPLRTRLTHVIKYEAACTKLHCATVTTILLAAPGLNTTIRTHSGKCNTLIVGHNLHVAGNSRQRVTRYHSGLLPSWDVERCLVLQLYHITCSPSDSPQIQQNNRFSTSYILKFYISWYYTNAQSFPLRGSCNVQALGSTFPEASTRAAIPTCHTQSVCALMTHDFLFASVCFSLPPCRDRIWPIKRNQRSLHR